MIYLLTRIIIVEVTDPAGVAGERFVAVAATVGSGLEGGTFHAEDFEDRVTVEGDGGVGKGGIRDEGGGGAGGIFVVSW